MKSYPSYKKVAEYLIGSLGRKPWVIEIGANDGVLNDPLRDLILKHDLPGVMVEPQPEVFKLLEENYAPTTRMQFKNVAVANENDVAEPLFYITDDIVDCPAPAKQDLPFGNVAGLYKAQASMDRSTIVKWLSRYGVEDCDKYISAMEADTMKLKEILQDVDYVDILQVDIQGLDWLVFEQFDFDRFHPYIVMFEENKKVDFCKDVLIQHGFNISPIGSNNYLAVRDIGRKPNKENDGKIQTGQVNSRDNKHLKR